MGSFLKESSPPPLDEALVINPIDITSHWGEPVMSEHHIMMSTCGYVDGGLLDTTLCKTLYVASLTTVKDSSQLVYHEGALVFCHYSAVLY